MKTEIEYWFDFRSPGRVELRCGNESHPAIEADTSVRFSVNDSSVAHEFSCALDPGLADAVDVAVAAHMADRLALRERVFPYGKAPFNRRLRLVLAVRNPEVWAAPPVKRTLISTLEYLTQDLWDFEFTNSNGGRTSDLQQYLFGQTIPTLPDVGLFSGGLDSFAGTAAVFEENPEPYFIGVSASPTNIHAGWQRQQFHRLQGAFRRPGAHISIRYSMRDGAGLAQERSRRTRGFVFLVLGSVVAKSTRSTRLHVYENGIGAINLPYDLSQVGVDNTRAMHPRTLRNVASLISLLTGESFCIDNRSMFLTKGQLCSHSAVRKVADSIAKTYSCDGLTHTGAHCGYCTSCLLRRQSLEFAGLSHQDTKQYLNNVLSGTWNLNRRRLRGLCGMTWQASRLRECLNSGSPWHALVSEFPELHAVANEIAVDLDEGVTQRSLVQLYQAYVDEWLQFSGLRHLPMRLAA